MGRQKLVSSVLEKWIYIHTTHFNYKCMWPLYPLHKQYLHPHTAHHPRRFQVIYLLICVFNFPMESSISVDADIICSGLSLSKQGGGPLMQIYSPLISH